MTKSSEKNPDLCEGFCLSGPINELQHKLVEVSGLSEIFKALGDETRVKILYLLAHQELCVCDLATIFELTLPAISHHLRLLKVLRLVKYRRMGKMVFYSLEDDHILNIIKQAQEHYMHD